MRIAVLGTGEVGRSLAARFASLGHDVAVGTRDVEATRAKHPELPLMTQADAAAHGEVVVNANGGGVTMAALTNAGAANLAGKVLIDVANPLDFSQGFPPTMSVKDTDSLAEQIQRAFPDARVVKTLNTVHNAVMVDPAALAGGDHTMFVSGDDADAKTVVSGLLAEMGWRDIIDLGPLQTARGLEMLLPLWVRLYGALGTDNFNVKVVR